MTLSELILSYRKSHHLTQRDLAVECNLSNAYISLLEKGESPKTGKNFSIHLKTIQKLADGMHCTPQSILQSVEDLEIATEEPEISETEIAKRVLFGTSEGISDALLEKVRAYAKALIQS